MSLDLSVHDKAVLNCIFNPSLPVTEAYDEIVEELIDEGEETCNKEWESVNNKQLEAIKIAENERNFERAIDLLNVCIQTLPEKPSIYNNRGQIYQFMGRFDDALDDLTKSITLADAQGNQKKTLCAALCQRGLLHRKSNRIELARQDYERASQLGSKFAKTQLIEINPYAAMCNQMLRKVMEDLK